MIPFIIIFKIVMNFYLLNSIQFLYLFHLILLYIADCNVFDSSSTCYAQ